MFLTIIVVSRGFLIVFRGRVIRSECFTETENTQTARVTAIHQRRDRELSVFVIVVSTNKLTVGWDDHSG